MNLNSEYYLLKINPYKSAKNKKNYKCRKGEEKREKVGKCFATVLKVLQDNLSCQNSFLMETSNQKSNKVPEVKPIHLFLQ